MGRVGGFLGELRRRHVFKVAVVYGAVAFVLVQAADLVFPALALPDWSYTFIVVLALMGFPVAVVLAWAFDLTPQGVERTRSGPQGEAANGEAPRSVEPSRTEGPALASAVGTDPRGQGGRRALDPSAIAVLPFTNLSGNPDDEYFSDGVTEDIIARVSKVGGLRVISRTSVMRYKGTTTSISEIAAALGVGHVLEGTVRRTPERVRIVAQLVDPATDLHLWVETYDRDMEDVFQIQSDVAGEVARALAAGLSPGRRQPEASGAAPTQSVEAYDDYLKARHEWNRRTSRAVERSLGHLDRAVERDPTFALAHAARADSWLTLAIYGAAPPGRAMARAREAASRALELAGDMTEALTARACVRTLHDWDAPGAEADFLEAIRLNPQYPLARQWYAMNLLVPWARFDEAAAQLGAAREVDPLSPVVEVSFAVLDFYRRDTDAARTRLESLLVEYPEFHLARYFLGLALTHAGHLGEAEARLLEASRALEAGTEVRAALGVVQALSGQEGQAREVLRTLEVLRRDGYVSPVLLAQVSVALGEAERALAFLDEARDERAVDLAWIGVRPVFDPLRDEPRFQALERAVLKDPREPLRPPAAHNPTPRRPL